MPPGPRGVGFWERPPNRTPTRPIFRTLLHAHSEDPSSHLYAHCLEVPARGWYFHFQRKRPRPVRTSVLVGRPELKTCSLSTGHFSARVSSKTYTLFICSCYTLVTLNHLQSNGAVSGQIGLFMCATTPEYGCKFRFEVGVGGVDGFRTTLPGHSISYTS